MNKYTAVTKATGSRYTDMDRREAAITYLVTGNLRATAKQTGVNERTLADWVKSDWWVPLLQTLHAEKGRELDGKMTQVIDAALHELSDRLANGDYKVGRDGTLIRVPVPAKDAAIVAAVMFDKRQILRNLPTQISYDAYENLNRIKEKLLAICPPTNQGGGGGSPEIEQSM